MNATPWRVLVADDDPTAALLSRAALAGDEFLPTVVASGDLALAAFRDGVFDIVLLDVEMPGLDGFEVCAAIRQSHGRDFPVVLVTGRCDAAFAERAGALSASIIAKPVDWSALAARLHAEIHAGRR